MRILLALALLGACSPQPATEVMVQVSSDFPADQLLGVRISVTRAADQSSLFSSCSCVGGSGGCTTMPTQLGLVSEGSLDHAFTVQAAGFSDGACGDLLVGQTATLQFFAHHTLRLDLSLLQVCKDKVCDPGSTCYNDGLCHSDAQSDLPSYDPNSRPATSPPPRLGHAMVYDPARKRIVMFGGAQDYDLSILLGDTWEWDGTRWFQVSGAAAPSARYASGFDYDQARGGALLFGGSGNNDSFIYDGTWTDVTASVGGGPAPSFPRMVFDTQRNQHLLFDENSETWALDGGGMWTALMPAHVPTARRLFALAYDTPSGQTVLFGGNDGSSDLGETWLWDGSDWTLSPATGPSAQEGTWMVENTALSSLVLYAGGETWEWTGAWTQDMVPGPPSRQFSRMAYDSDRKVIVLFGGWDGSAPLADTWEFGSDRVWRQR